MPSGNPFAPVVDVGGSVGPVSGAANIGVGGVDVGDHHVSAAFVLLGLVILVALYQRRWRFSTQIG